MQANSKELLPKMAPGDAKVTFRLPTGGRTTLCQIRVTLNPDGTVSSPMYQIGDSGVCGVDVLVYKIKKLVSGKSGRNTVKVQFIVEKAAMNLNKGEIMNINTSN